MTNKLLAITIIASAALASAPGSLRAAPRRGVAIAPAELAASHRAALQRQIASARRSDAVAFAALAELRARLPELARHQRGRMVNVLLPLRALRAAGLMPMLAELAVDARARGDLPERAWRGWQVSLLEAAGALGDARAEPVLTAILRSEQRDGAVLRGAARALGRVGTKSAVRTLVRAARAADAERRLAVLTALGDCRDPAAARALARALARAGADGPERGAVIMALGQVGNAWAWKARARRGQGAGAEQTRRIAVDALVAAYPSFGSAHREAAAKALLVISHPDTRARISAARARLGAQRGAALDALQQRIARDGLLR